MPDQAVPRQDPAAGPQSAPRQRFRYTPLAKDAIRLALLRRDEPGDGTIKVDLLTAQWPPSLPYEALSYVWGETTNRSPILVSADGASPQPFSVTQNLYAALRGLRRGACSRPLWIDALCIDQENMDEKEQQVSKMDRIYQAAENVCVWLGPGSPESDRAMTAVPKILRSISDASFGKGPDDWRDWELFADLLQNRWFSRRWVVQEIALARTATVRCGRQWASWTDFSDAISLYVSWQASSWSSVAKAPDAIVAGASTLSYLSENAFRKDSQGNILEHRWNTEDFLALLPMFQAEVPHDAIYAILSIASDSRELPLVDYSKPAAQLFTEVFEHIAARSSRSLDMMFRPWAPEIPGERLPSFIAPASRSTHIRRACGRVERRNADSLVGSPRRRIYAATPNPTTPSVLTLPPCDIFSRDLVQILRLDPAGPRIKNNCMLAARGVICAVISELCGVAEDGNIPQDWLEAWRREQGRFQYDIWRVLVAGRSLDGAAAPNWYRRAFEDVLANSSNNMNLDNKRGLNLADMLGTSQSRTIAPFLNRVSACVWGRRFLASTRDGPEYIGLVPREAAPGDMICLLEGCSVPVIIRGKPMTEWVLPALQALQPVLMAPGFLSPYIEEQIVHVLQACVSQRLEHFVKRSLERLKSSVPGYALDGADKARFANKPRRLSDRRLPSSLSWVLTESVAVTLRDLSKQHKDELLESALTLFFRNLIPGVLEGQKMAMLSSSLPMRSMQDPSWADAPIRQLFQPLFARAYERAAEQAWRREAENVLGPSVLRDRTSEATFGTVWPTVWKKAWADSSHLVQLWSGELGIGRWRKPFKDGLEYWIDEHFGVSGAYGGEVIGECYIQGLMEGERWNAGNEEKQDRKVFIIG